MNEIPIAVNFDSGEGFGVNFNDGMNLSFTTDDELLTSVNIDSDKTFGVTFDNAFAVNISDIHTTGEYSGPYEVTPTNAVQTLPTTGKSMAHDIKVNPIPSNYGLIGWNGSVLSIT